jgi:hypothetical protein
MEFANRKTLAQTKVSRKVVTLLFQNLANSRSILIQYSFRSKCKQYIMHLMNAGVISSNTTLLLIRLGGLKHD